MDKPKWPSLKEHKENMDKLSTVAAKDQAMKDMADHKFNTGGARYANSYPNEYRTGKAIENTTLLEYADAYYDVRGLNSLPNPAAGILEIVSKFIQSRFCEDRKQNSVDVFGEIDFTPGKVIHIPNETITTTQLRKLFDSIDSLNKLDISDWENIYGACADYGIPLLRPEEDNDGRSE